MLTAFNDQNFVKFFTLTHSVVYTLFALCEYCTIVSNILFHWFSLTTHFKGAVLLLAYGESNKSKMS